MRYPSPEDILEMEARGYERFTIDKAVAQSKRWPRAQAICDEIRSAFRDVKLGDGVGLSEGRGLDDYEDEATCAAWRENDEKDDWSRISSEALSLFNTSLSFFDAEGMRFHLPAFMIAELRGEYEHGMAFPLTYLDEHSRSRFALFTDEQRATVRSFLLFIAEDEDHYSCSRQSIEAALAGFWVAPGQVPDERAMQQDAGAWLAACREQVAQVGQLLDTLGGLATNTAESVRRVNEE